MRLFAAAVITVLAAPVLLLAQYAQTCPTLPPPLYVRLAGPAGMKVTLYRGTAPAQSFDCPCLLAFRPGYRYRIELSNLPDRLRPQALVGSPTAGTVCPTFDVVGSLQPASGMRASDHPATINFTEDDFATIRTGAVVTKVVLLERPETAEPVATTSDNPLEITVPPYRNPVLEAQQRGRPLIILHMGERQATPQELAAECLPGTLMAPGEKVLAVPHDPPCLPWMCYPCTALPSAPNEICFHDGGDEGLPAGIGPDGKLVGLDPADTVAQYFDSRGKQKIAISNKVCLCVPRYVLIRTAVTAASNTQGTPTGDTRVAHAPATSRLESYTVQYQQDVIARAMLAGQRVSGIINIQQTQVVGQMEGVVVYAKAEGTGSITSKCPEPQLAEIEKPLVIIKWPDKCDPGLGEIVTFFIRYKNEGQKPITGIIVNDSLTARLEYVRNTARSDRDALFTTTPNEVDSTVLRWEVSSPLLPGQMGTVTFQARVR